MLKKIVTEEEKVTCEEYMNKRRKFFKRIIGNFDCVLMGVVFGLLGV